MKRGIAVRIYTLTVLFLLLFGLTGCPPPVDPPVMPTMTTTNAGSITTSSATAGGNITTDGGASITGRGVCWGISSGPTIANSKTSDGTGTGSFSSSLSGLNPGVTYFIRAYATNSAGTGYGNEVSFTTLANLPTLTTTSVTAITTSSATSGGNITSDGGAAISARGICWSTTAGPTISNTKTTDGTGVGSFVSSMTALNPGIKYYVRAYATNSAGTAYGSEVSFTVTVALPALTTASLSGITSSSAGCGGNVTNDGGAAVTARGVCWSTSQSPTIVNTRTIDGSGLGNFTSAITGLLPGTFYFIRAYATNGNGTAYGNEVSLFTTAVIPTLTTSDVSVITANSLTSGGTITSDGGNAVTARGVCYSINPNPNIVDNGKILSGSGTGSFTSILTGLVSGTTFYIRAFATNAMGTAYGNQVTGITTATVNLATITTNAVTAVTSTTATSGGIISSDGGAAVTARGVCWSTTSTPTTANNFTSNGTGTGNFTSSLTNIIPGTTYYIRAYATNSAGTVYGTAVSFTTLSIGIIFNPNKSYGSLTDNDGNVYKTIVIGTQTWMAENLKTSKYKDGTAIPLVTANSSWGALSTPGYCWYNNDAATYKGIYGALYNWYTVNTGKLCPTGWHVPSITEWNTLISYVGGTGNAADKLKETTTIHWNTPNTAATNEYGFTGLPGGCRGIETNSYTYNIGEGGYWWYSDSFDNLLDNRAYFIAFQRSVPYSTTQYNDLKYGFSVRCISGELSLSTLSTTSVSSIATTTAVSGGNISNDGGSAITERGVCWGTTANPTIAVNKTSNGIGTGGFTSSITGLTPNTTYYVRAYAINSAGTAYGTQVSFTTSPVSSSTVTDINGNIYNTITIGTQVWMKENLKATKYKDGIAIPLVTDNVAWSYLTTPGYCWHNNDSIANKNVYGALYNWYTVKTGKLCPSGWHVPSTAEWISLGNFLGSTAGGKLKEAGTSHWQSPNFGATNETGFTALPGSYRATLGTFGSIGTTGFFWSSTEDNFSRPWIRTLGNSSDYLNPSNLYYFQNGFSVRCLKD